MIALPSDLPLVTWSSGRPVPLSSGWLTESIDFSLAGENFQHWQWTQDIVEAICLHLKEDYPGTEIHHVDLLRIVKESIEVLGYPEVAHKIELTAPRVVIHLPEIAQRADIELVFFQELQYKLDEALSFVVRGVKLEGIRDSVKTLHHTKRWKRNCQTLNDDIVEFVRKNLERWNQPAVELIIR
ncbi:MAG: hypothetical protein AAF571_14730 [Verrucomicrobiota bacterium]